MHHHYRGYDISIEEKGNGWSVWAHPTTADLPITRRNSFAVDAPSETEALAEVRRQIDELLEPD